MGDKRKMNDFEIQKIRDTAFRSGYNTAVSKYEKQNKELQEENAELEDRNAVLEKRIERVKECMKKLLFIINSDPANYNCKGLTQDAEDFIYNRTCNIRQQGEHCISETRCIMCDK